MGDPGGADPDYNIHSGKLGSLQKDQMSFLLFALAVLFYTCSQVITFGKFRLKGAFWQSSDRKYKEPKELAPSTWYYKLAVLKYRERFPGSGTVFVSLTDGYHFTQLLFKLSLVAALVLYRPWLGLWDAAVYLVIWGVVFTLANRFVSV